MGHVLVPCIPGNANTPIKKYQAWCEHDVASGRFLPDRRKEKSAAIFGENAVIFEENRPPSREEGNKTDDFSLVYRVKLHKKAR